jgi:hypothetical protein
MTTEDNQEIVRDLAYLVPMARAVPRGGPIMTPRPATVLLQLILVLGVVLAIVLLARLVMGR